VNDDLGEAKPLPIKNPNVYRLPEMFKNGAAKRTRATGFPSEIAREKCPWQTKSIPIVY
jgi:hypothetical protein